MDNLPVEVDIVTYGGLVITIPMLIWAVKKVFKKKVEGWSARMCFAFSYLIGIPSKFFIAGAFVHVSWVLHPVMLLLVAAFAMVARDKMKDVFGGGK